MRIDSTILHELKSIGDLTDFNQVKARLESLISALEESLISSGATTSSASVSEVMAPSETARHIHDILERSDAKSLSEFLLKNKSAASITLDATTGVTVLHRAVEMGNLEIVDLLMSQIDSEAHSARFLHNLNGEILVSDIKKRLNVCTRVTGYTPLHFAVSSGNDRVVAELLKRGADSEHRSTDEQGVSPFLLACELGQDMAVRMMIKASQGKCVDSTDAQGNTALHLAAENGHATIVEVLMSVMPQLEREQNSEGKTATELAKDSKRPDIAHLIQQLANSVKDQANSQGGFFFG
jgi:ankyrin repeat protein